MAYSQDNAPTAPSSPEDPSTTPSNFPVPKNGHAAALAVTLSLVGVLLIVGITFFTMRMRRARSAQQEMERSINNSPRKSMILDPRHPASHITPYGSEYLSICHSQFLIIIFLGSLGHSPGTMRIARRRLDGAWDFEDPEAPFEPQGVADPSPHPLSSLSSERSTIRRNVSETVTERDRKRDTDSSAVSSSRLEPPPPAYQSELHSDESYTTTRDS